MEKNDAKKPAASDVAARGAYYWDQFERLIERKGYRPKDVLQHVPACVMRRDLPKFPAHYELFRQVIVISS